MDEAKLQEIEARANAATPGPWRSGGFYGLGRVQDGDHAGWVLGGAFPIGRCAFCARAPEPCSATVMHRGEYDAAPRAYHAHWIAAEPGEGWQGISSDAVALAITGNYDYDRGGVRSTPEDSAFIAHARTDVPALVAEVRRLTVVAAGPVVVEGALGVIFDAVRKALGAADGEVTIDVAQRVVAERDALRAVAATRDTPPSDEELAAHEAAGGTWLCVSEGRPCIAERRSGARYLRGCGAVRWIPLDADGRPCAWPVASKGGAS